MWPQATISQKTRQIGKLALLKLTFAKLVIDLSGNTFWPQAKMLQNHQKGDLTH